MSTPSVTPVQMLGGGFMALVVAAFPVLEAFGHGLNSAQTLAITGFVTAFVSFAVIADAVIRNGRSRVAAAKVAKPSPAPKARPKR